MDKKIINELGQNILCHRLRSKRSKKRAAKKGFEKSLIHLNKERNKLWQAQRNLGWEPVTPPYQKGWKRSFVLRDDVVAEAKADFFQSILDKINTVQYSYRKDFKIKKRNYGRKILVDKDQHLMQLEPYHKGYLQLSADERIYFEEQEVLKYNKLCKVFVFTQPWRFKLLVTPNIIDKRRKKDAALEAQLQQIENYLEKNNLSGKMYRLLDGSYRRKRYRNEAMYSEKNILENKSLAQIMDIVTDEK